MDAQSVTVLALLCLFCAAWTVFLIMRNRFFLFHLAGIATGLSAALIFHACDSVPPVTAASVK